MRNLKLLLGKDETKEKWFWSFPGYSYEKFTKFWTHAPQEPFFKKITKLCDLRNYPHNKTVIQATELFTEANLEWLKKWDQNCTREIVEYFEKIIPTIYLYHKNETAIFSFYALNEFLASSAAGTYGNYLDANWDKLYKEMSLGHFRKYSHTARIGEAITINNSILMLRLRSATPARKALENLNREELGRLSNLPPNLLSAASGILVEHIKSSLSTEEKKIYSIEHSRDRLFLGFANACSGTDEQSAQSPVAMAHILLKYLERLGRAFHEEKTNSKSGSLDSSVLHSIAVALQKESPSMRPRDFLLIAFLLTEPSAAMGNTGKLASLRLLEKISKLTPESQATAFNLLGEAAQAKTRRLPPLAAWETLMDEESLTVALDLGVAIELMGGKDVLKYANPSADLNSFLSDLRHTRRSK